MLGVVTAMLIAFAAPARAHATLQQVTPADGANLDAVPNQVTLQFDEAVTTPPSGIRVFDRNGDRVDQGNAGATGEVGELAVSLRENLGQGTYVVAWRAVSADGHPLKGAWLFTVGDVAADRSLLADVFSSEDGREAAITAVAVRWLLYVVTMLGGGAAMIMSRLSGLLGGGLQPRARRIIRVIRLSAVAGLVLTVVGVLAQVMLVTGLGVQALTDGAALLDVAASGYGYSAAIRFLALVGLLTLASTADSTTGKRGVIAAVLGAVAVASFALEGHTVTTSPLWLVATSGVVHVLAAAVWSAGLVVLAVAIGRGSTRQAPIQTARLVAAFSGIATWTILGVAIAGIALGWAEVRALRALTSTTYGWTLLAKLLLLVPVAAAAMYNNRRLVPAVVAVARPLSEGGRSHGHPVPAGGSTDVWPERRHDPAVARLRRSLRIELVGVVAVLAATALLVGLQPAAEAAGISGAYSTYVPLGDEYEVNLTVDPNRVGPNEIHLYILGTDGRQVDVSSDVAIELRHPERDVGPLRRSTTRLGPGHFFLSGPELSVPGIWEITVEVPVSRFDVLTATIPVTVNAGP